MITVLPGSRVGRSIMQTRGTIKSEATYPILFKIRALDLDGAFQDELVWPWHACNTYPPI